MQFHIDVEEEVSRTPGPVQLQLPGLHSVQQQLQKCAALFDGTDFEVKPDAEAQQLRVTDPWGQVFLISEAETKDGVAGARIASLVFPCHQGTAAAIAQFYIVNLQVRTTTAVEFHAQCISVVACNMVVLYEQRQTCSARHHNCCKPIVTCNKNGMCQLQKFSRN